MTDAARECEYTAEWTMYVKVQVPSDVDADSQEAHDMASETAARRLAESGPDGEDVTCDLDPEDDS